jgi:hypothetical protein
MLVGAAVLNFARDSEAAREELRRVMGVLVERLLTNAARSRRPARRKRRGGGGR